MKKIIIGIGVMLLFFAFAYQANIVKAVGAFFRSGSDNAQYRTSEATTSPAWIRAGLSTSTLTFNTSDCSSITVETQLFASSTATASWLQINVYASDNRIDFYNYDNFVQDTTRLISEISLASSTRPLSWKQTTVGATSTKVFQLKLIPSRNTRLEFAVGTTTSGTPAQKDGMNVWNNVSCNIQNY